MKRFNSLLFLLLIFTCSCQTPHTADRCLASDVAADLSDPKIKAANSCRELFENNHKFRVISGGRKEAGHVVKMQGFNGGAFEAIVELDGKRHLAVETSAYIAPYWGYPEDKIKTALDMTLVAYQLAAQKGIAPRVYGFRDEMIDGQLTRLIYLEKKGNALELMPELPQSFELNPDTLEYWLRKVDRAEAKRILGPNVREPAYGKSEHLIKYLVDDRSFSELTAEISSTWSFHPDPMAKNVLLEFSKDDGGSYHVKAWYIDWDNKNKSIAERRAVIQRLKALPIRD